MKKSKKLLAFLFFTAALFTICAQLSLANTGLF